MKDRNTRITKKGFTLIELLIVIGIIGFLAAAVLVAVDPVKRIQDSRNAQRWSEVNSLLNAILKYQVDNRTLFNGGDNEEGIALEGNVIITHATNAQVIIDNAGSATADLTTIDCSLEDIADYCPGADAAGLTGSTTDGECMADLGLVNAIIPTYIAELPTDPGEPSAVGTTGYYIHRTSGNRITIGACDAEQGATISVRR